MNEENLLVKEVAEELRCTPAFIYKLIDIDGLPAERYGVGRGHIVIPKAAFEEYRKLRGINDEAKLAGLKKQYYRFLIENLEEDFGEEGLIDIRNMINRKLEMNEQDQ